MLITMKSDGQNHICDLGNFSGQPLLKCTLFNNLQPVHRAIFGPFGGQCANVGSYKLRYWE